MNLKTVLLLSTVITFSSTIFSQNLEPRFLSSMPTGGNFAIASYAYSEGNILIDNALPIDNLNAEINSAVVGYARSFKLFKQLAKFDVIAPYSFATFSGTVSNIDSSTSRNGLADPMARISIILIGGKAQKMADFIKTPPAKFKLGISLRVRVPFGDYNNTKLINLGANRWGTKIGIATSYNITKKIIIEGHLTSWFFTENKDFWNGNTLYQKPLYVAQLHTTYIFKPGVWIAASFGVTGSGETVLNGVDKNDQQQSSKYGLAFAYKLNNNHAVKFALTSGISTRYGADFTTIAIAYQFMWFDKH